MTVQHKHDKRRARSVASALAILGLMGTALLWGWNTFAVDVLALPAIRFRHALALEVFLISVACTVPLARRLIVPSAPRTDGQS